MELALGLFVGGIVIFACLYLWLRRGGYATPVFDAPAPAELSLAASSDPVLIAGEHGDLIYVNDPARN